MHTFSLDFFYWNKYHWKVEQVAQAVSCKIITIGLQVYQKVTPAQFFPVIFVKFLRAPFAPKVVLQHFFFFSFLKYLEFNTLFYTVRSFDYRWNNNLIMFLYKRNIYFILENLILFLLLSHFLVNISTANTDKVALMLFSQGWGSADEHTLTQLSFSDKYQRWNNIGSSTLNWHRSFIVVSTLLSQRWNNVHKHTSAQLSFSTKFQRWNNVGLSSLNGCNSIEVLLVLFCQRWNNVDKCTLAQLSFSTKYQLWNNVDERWQPTSFQRWCVCWGRDVFF